MKQLKKKVRAYCHRPNYMPRIQKSLLWLERYIKTLNHSKLIDLRRIYAIRAFKLPLTKMETTLARCARLGNNKHYIITLRLATHKQEYKNIRLKTTTKRITKNIDHQAIPIREILSDLAHEIAHAADWDADHNIDHEINMYKIYLIFLRQLNKDIKNGIIKAKDA